MIKIGRKFISLTIFLWVFGFLSGAGMAAEDVSQKILDLRKQIETLTKQAELYKKNITQKRKEADSLARQIDLLKNQVLKLQTQIAITDNKIYAAKFEISILETKIYNAQEKINQDRTAVGKLLSLMAERDRLSLTAVLMKYRTLSAASNIIQQEQNLTARLGAMLVDLKEQKTQLQNSKTDLENKKKELEDLNRKQTDQKNAITENQNAKNRLLTTTKGKEKEYQKLLSEAEAKQEQFFAELKKLEDEAVKAGAYIVHVAAANLPARGTKIFQWPEEDFYITQNYGVTNYSKRGVYGGAPHNGIDISSGAGSPIKAIANGAILASGYNNGWGNWAAVRHAGGLVSVYAHLRAPSGIANGTTVSVNSIIGYEGSTGNSTGSHLHLSVYRDFFTYINPSNGQLYFNYFAGSINPSDYL